MVGATWGTAGEMVETRCVSVWQTAFNTKERADQTIADLEEGGFNTVYGMTFWMRAFYRSDKYPTQHVTDDFDSVGYMNREGAQAGMEILRVVCQWPGKLELESGDLRRSFGLGFS